MPETHFHFMLRRARLAGRAAENTLNTRTIRWLDGRHGVERRAERIRKQRNKNQRKDLD